VIVATSSEVSFRIRNAADTKAVVKRLRTAVAIPVVELARAIETQQPVVVRHLHGQDHDEAETVVLTLLQDLEATPLLDRTGRSVERN
jgi:hypothetical protein